MTDERNAIIMAAGTSSRFVPLSYECPKALLEVKGEILIERQIRQLNDAGIKDVTIVVGYKASMLEYLKDKFGVKIVLNEDYAHYNNTSSIIRAIDKLDNTFVCSSDNYFVDNVFIKNPKYSYYSALYARGKTGEYCLSVDKDDNITNVVVGGQNSWYMVGHVFFNRDFSEAFRKIMLEEYISEETRQGYWEDVYIKHINHLPKMKINRYKDCEIKEFDTIDELRKFDDSYNSNTRSSVVKEICAELKANESDIHSFKNIKHYGEYLLFNFKLGDREYIFNSQNGVKIDLV